MKPTVRANILLTTLLLSLILTTLFLAREQVRSLWVFSEAQYQHYLSGKLQFEHQRPRDLSALCQSEQRTPLIYHYAPLFYSWHCKRVDLFKKPQKITKNYYAVEQFEDVLNFLPPDVVYISNLAQLPATSEENPAIVITLNDISGRLLQHFYGVILTEYLLDITDKKIYGVVFSRYDNDRGDRDFVYRGTVRATLNDRYSYWHYLPFSQNMMLKDDETD